MAVDYEPLPPAVVDPFIAADGEVLLFPELGTNQVLGFGHASRG